MPDSAHYCRQRRTVSKLNRNTDADTQMHSVYTDKQLTHKAAHRQEDFPHKGPATLYLEMTHNCYDIVYPYLILCMASNWFFSSPLSDPCNGSMTYFICDLSVGWCLCEYSAMIYSHSSKTSYTKLPYWKEVLILTTWPKTLFCTAQLKMNICQKRR